DSDWRLVADCDARAADWSRAWIHPRCDRHRADRSVAAFPSVRLRRALSSRRAHRRSCAGWYRVFRIARRLDAAVRLEAGWVRSRERVGSLCRNARGRDGARDLFHRGVDRVARDAAVTLMRGLAQRRRGQLRGRTRTDADERATTAHHGFPGSKTDFTDCSSSATPPCPTSPDDALCDTP